MSETKVEKETKAKKENRADEERRVEVKIRWANVILFVGGIIAVIYFSRIIDFVSGFSPPVTDAFRDVFSVLFFNGPGSGSVVAEVVKSFLLIGAAALLFHLFLKLIGKR